MHKKIFAVEIDDDCIKLAYGRCSSEGLILEKAFYNGCDELKNRIQSFISKNHIKTRYVSLILRSRELIIKFASFTNIRPRDVASVLKHDLKSYIPVDSGKYIVDYKITRASGLINVLIAALPEKTAKAYISVFKELGITPLTADIYQNCVSRAFPTEKNTLVISESSGRIQLSFLDNGILNGVRDIPFTNEEFIISEISKLFDNFLTNRVFESAHILSSGLDFLKSYFDLSNIRCSMEDADFFALERGIFYK